MYDLMIFFLPILTQNLLHILYDDQHALEDIYLSKNYVVYLADEHCSTLTFTRFNNPSKMRSIPILLFLFNSFLDAVFGYFELMYPVTTEYQTSYPFACKNVFIILLHNSYSRAF
jgi:hypothetical protein